MDPAPEPRDYAQRLAKGSTIVFTAMVLSGFVGFLLRVFLAHSLSLSDYGLFYAVFAFVSFFTIFCDLGLNSAIVKHIPEFSVRREFGAVKSSIVLTALFQAMFAFFVAAMLFIFSGQISLAVFRTGAAVTPLQILSAWFFVTAFYQLIRSSFQGFQNMPAYALMDTFWIMLVLLAAVLSVGVLGQGVKGVASAYLIATLVMFASALAYLVRRYQRFFKEKMLITKTLLKRLFVFALPVFIGGLGGIIMGYMATIMITVTRTLPEVGYYQAAQPTASVLLYFVGALTAVFFPMVSELWAKREKKLLVEGLRFLTKFSFILILPFAFLFIAFPEIVIRLLFGEGYLAGAVTLQILACSAIVSTLFAVLSCAIVGIGKPVVNMKVVGAMACLDFVGNLLLIPPYGIEGAAIATLSACTLGLVLMFYYARKFVGSTVPASPLLKTVIGGALTLLLIFGLKFILVLPPWPETFAVMILGLLFYGVWILATKAITRDDLRLIKNIVPMPKWLIRVAGKFIKS
jgi:O-antigen/teichoic acid export membrane protein